MPRPPAKNPRLVDRDYEIFQHVMRYHMTTREVLHRLFFSDSEENAATKVTSRLTLHGFFNRYDLYPPRTYFLLGPQAARIMGVSPKKTKEFGPQALVREYATLAYCCLAPEPRTRLTVREIQQRHTQLLQPKLDSSHYYLDNDGQKTRLAYIRVDYGGPPEHIVRKCKEDIDARYSYPAFRELIDGGGFLIAIVTARDEKAAAIHDALKRHDWQNTRFRIEVVPDLVHLLTRFESG
jgi:hypothetical protein